MTNHALAWYTFLLLSQTNEKKNANQKNFVGTRIKQPKENQARFIEGYWAILRRKVHDSEREAVKEEHLKEQFIRSIMLH